MTLSKRSDRENPGSALSEIIKANRQSAFFFLSGTTGFLAIGSLLKYSDFRAGAGLIILLALIGVAVFGFYNFAKVIAKRNILSHQKEQVAIVLSMVPLFLTICLILVGFII